MKENTRENLLNLGIWGGIAVVLAGGFMLVTSGEPSPDKYPQSDSTEWKGPQPDLNRERLAQKVAETAELRPTKCNDGTFSTSRGSGSCSRHGGVDSSPRGEVVTEDYPGQHEAESWTGPNMNRNGNG